MAAHSSDRGAWPVLQAVLQSIESVRNAPALYLLMLGFASSGLLAAMAQRALAGQSPVGGTLYLAAAALAVFYASNAAGLVLMDEARGTAARHPLDALRDALALGHRLLLVVGLVLLAAATAVAVLLGLLQASRWHSVGPLLMGAAVALGVPAIGLLLLGLMLLVAPLAAPAVWAGLRPLAVLALLWRQTRQRFAHVVILGAAVSLLSAAVAGLLSIALLAAAQLLLGLALGVAELDLAPQPVLAALFGRVWLQPAGVPALSPLTEAARTGASMVFALGLVLPAAVYLRGLCELFLALQRLDEPPAAPSLDSRLPPPTA